MDEPSIEDNVRVKSPIRVKAGRKSKRKGSANERAVAKQLQDWWQHGVFTRTPASGGWATATTREAFKTCGDIITTAEDWPFCCELKKQETWNLDQLLHNEKCILWTWWEQVVNETPAGLTPLLLIARNHVPQTVMFSFGAMLQLVKKFQDPKSPCYPWQEQPHFMFDLGVLRALEGDTSWVIMPLEHFFKISPDLFGRKMTNGQQSKSETVRPAVAVTTT